MLYEHVVRKAYKVVNVAAVLAQRHAAMKRLPPAQGSDQSPTSAGSDTLSQTYAIDIVQKVRVTSNEPLTRRRIDAVKKSLGKLGLGAGDRGCVSDDDGLRVVQTGMEVVRGGDARPAPSPSPRPHSASPGGSTRKKLDPKSSNQGLVQPPKRILFYHANDPYYGFTNFSPDPVEYRGKRYPTSEHLFQSLKVSRAGGPPQSRAQYIPCIASLCRGGAPMTHG